MDDQQDDKQDDQDEQDEQDVETYADDEHEDEQDVETYADDEHEDEQDVETYDEEYGGADGDDWPEDTAGSDWTDDRDAASTAGVAPLVAAGLVGLATVLVLVLVLVWIVVGRDGDGARDASGDASTAGRTSAGTTSALPADTPRGRMSRLGRCVRAEGALRETLEAARPALDQWAVHVGAMNQLVVGEITLQQATAFWERTRVGAQRRVRDFDDSLGALRTEGVDCPDPAFLAPGSRALPACAREVQVDVRALQAARVSVSTWKEHIHHMDMLRLGQMTPEQATKMWLSSWQRGVRDLDAYEFASKAANREQGCSQAGSSR